jgi:hypothetical protein
MYLESVVPIYTLDQGQKYFSEGSGVLIEHRSRKFIVTAAHVVEGIEDRRTFAFIGNFLYELKNYKSFTSNMDHVSDRKEDAIDLAVIPLQFNEESQSLNLKFITEKECLLGLSDPSPFFKAIGFPHKKNTRAANRSAKTPGGFRTKPFGYVMFEAKNRAFPYKGYAPESHIATESANTGFESETGKYVDIQKLNGMSGGLLQKMNHLNARTKEFETAYPVGIILEQKEDKTAIYSLKLTAVFAWLSLHWNDITSDDEQYLAESIVVMPLMHYVNNGDSITRFMNQDINPYLYILLEFLYNVIIIRTKPNGDHEVVGGYITKISRNAKHSLFKNAAAGYFLQLPELLSQIDKTCEVRFALVDIPEDIFLNEQELELLAFRGIVEHSTLIQL